MSLQAFFAQNTVSEREEEVIFTDRFKDKNGNPVPWKIRALSEAENEAIRKSATEMVKGKNGVKIPEVKTEDYLGKIAVACVVFPDLKDAELQQSYNVLGADALLKKMLYAGEYAALMQKVQEVNGFDRDINDLMEEAKN